MFTEADKFVSASINEEQHGLHMFDFFSWNRFVPRYNKWGCSEYRELMGGCDNENKNTQSFRVAKMGQACHWTGFKYI